MSSFAYIWTVLQCCVFTAVRRLSLTSIATRFFYDDLAAALGTLKTLFQLLPSASLPHEGLLAVPALSVSLLKFFSLTGAILDPSSSSVLYCSQGWLQRSVGRWRLMSNRRWLVAD